MSKFLITEGDTLICVYAATQFFTKDKEYTVQTNPDGRLCIIGDDGIADLIPLTTKSQFKKKEETDE